MISGFLPTVVATYNKIETNQLLNATNKSLF